MDLKQHWQGLRREAARLDPESAAADLAEAYEADRTHLQRSQKEIWLISLENPAVGSKGGQVVSAHPMNAARMLFDRTHQEARPAEVAAHQSAMDRRREQTELEESARKGTSPQKLIEMLIAAQQPRPAAPRTTTKGDNQ